METLQAKRGKKGTDLFNRRKIPLRKLNKSVPFYCIQLFGGFGPAFFAFGIVVFLVGRRCQGQAFAGLGAEIFLGADAAADDSHVATRIEAQVAADFDAGGVLQDGLLGAADTSALERRVVLLGLAGDDDVAPGRADIAAVDHTAPGVADRVGGEHVQEVVGLTASHPQDVVNQTELFQDKLAPCTPSSMRLIVRWSLT